MRERERERCKKKKENGMNNIAGARREKRGKKRNGV